MICLRGFGVNFIFGLVIKIYWDWCLGVFSGFVWIFDVGFFEGWGGRIKEDLIKFVKVGLDVGFWWSLEEGLVLFRLVLDWRLEVREVNGVLWYGILVFICVDVGLEGVLRFLLEYGLCLSFRFFRFEFLDFVCKFLVFLLRLEI